MDYSKKRTHNFVVIAKDQGGQSSKKTRALVQIVVIETLKHVTRKLATPTISSLESSSTELSNKISETKKIAKAEFDQERTRSSSSTSECFIGMPWLFTTLILLLRALVT